MKNKLIEMWRIIRVRPDLLFFSLFLLTFTLSIRKILFYFPIVRTFNEYNSIYVSLADIFLIATLLLYILEHKISLLSIWINPSKLFFFKNVPRGTKLKNLFESANNNYIILFPLLLVIYSFVAIFWSINKEVSLFKTFKLLEAIALYFYILLNVSRGTIPNKKQFTRIIFFIFIFIGLIHSLIAIAQFLLQHSIGLLWLKESVINPQIAGVAKVLLHGNKFIRAYGLFPHPNILGGYLAISIILTFLSLKLFHVEHKKIYYLILLQSLALVLTFSKSAILGLFLAITYIFIKLVPRGTKISFHKAFFVSRGTIKSLFAFIFSLAVFFLLILSLTHPDYNSLFLQSLRERVLYIEVSLNIIQSNPIFGIGAGQVIPYMANHYTLASWQFQPTHNVFLLILAEYGLLIFVGFIFFLYKLFHVEQLTKKRSQKGNYVLTNTVFRVVLCSIFFILLLIMLFDHYLWDLQQGIFLFWIIIALILNQESLEQ